jgi:hypothetical protein
VKAPKNQKEWEATGLAGLPTPSIRAKPESRVIT